MWASIILLNDACWKPHVAPVSDGSPGHHTSSWGSVSLHSKGRTEALTMRPPSLSLIIFGSQTEPGFVAKDDTCVWMVDKVTVGAQSLFSIRLRMPLCNQTTGGEMHHVFSMLIFMSNRRTVCPRPYIYISSLRLSTSNTLYIFSMISPYVY